MPNQMFHVKHLVPEILAGASVVVIQKVPVRIFHVQSQAVKTLVILNQALDLHNDSGKGVCLANYGSELRGSMVQREVHLH